MSGAEEGVMGASWLTRLGFSGEKFFMLHVAKVRSRDLERSLRGFQGGVHHVEKILVTLWIRMVKVFSYTVQTSHDIGYWFILNYINLRCESLLVKKYYTGILHLYGGYWYEMVLNHLISLNRAGNWANAFWSLFTTEDVCLHDHTIMSGSIIRESTVKVVRIMAVMAWVHDVVHRKYDTRVSFKWPQHSSNELVIVTHDVISTITHWGKHYI